MAASEAVLFSWKTPFSTPIRKDESACRDLFQNSEKLLASAVSICRLKGSVECQTGGLITVCEELQSLIRLAFSEIRRIEKDFNSQRSHFEDEITCLKENIKYLEEKNGHSKHYNKIDDCIEVNETTYNENRGKLSEFEETTKTADCSIPDENIEESDPCLLNTDSTNFKVDSVDDDALHVPVSPKEQEKSKSPSENKRSKKCSRKLSSKKKTNSSESASEVEDLHPSADSGDSGNKEVLEQKLTRSTENSLSNDTMEKENMESEDAAVVERTEVEVPKSDSDFKRNLKGGKEKTKVKNSRKKKRCLSLEDSDGTSEDKMPEADAKHQEEIKDTKKGKKKRSLDEGDFKEGFQAEISGDEVIQLDTEIKTKAAKKKKTDSPVYERQEVKPNKKLSRTKKSKSSSEDMPDTIREEMVTRQSEPVETSQKQLATSTANGMSSKNVKSSKRESTTTEDNDEQLGDMSFLINVNSRIALFVADASQEECELQPMTARERNDVYKVTHLYKLRARMGTKTENNLTTVRLSKQADTRMPKPGRVDSLLSELSIAASKVAFKESPKNQEKRKYSSVTEGDDQTVAEDGLDRAALPKKKLAKLSRSKKH